MPGLNDLLSVNLNGQQRGAYMEPVFYVEGLDTPVSLSELLEYILDNLGGEGGGGDLHVIGATLSGTNLVLTLNDASTVTVSLATLEDIDTNTFLQSAVLGVDNVLTLTLSDGSTVTVDLSSLAGGGGGAGLSIYNAGQGIWVKGTAGITATSGAAGVYNLNVPSGGILESLQKNFTNAGTEFTVGGEVVININWNTGAFNTSFADAVLPNIKLIDAAGTQREPAAVAVTVQHTAVAGGSTSTTVANINGVGTPIRIKGIL